MYVARFESGNVFLATAVLGWPAATLPGRTGWAHVLRRFPRVDAGLRVSSLSNAGRVALILCADAALADDLRGCHDALLNGLANTGLVSAGNAREFDALTAIGATAQLRVNHEGYFHRGVPLGCEFKLYGAFASRGDLGATYQLNMKFHQPDVDIERRVLKHLAWLDLEQPFTDPVRAMQRSLVQRLREPGWFANEYLAVDDQSALDGWTQRMNEHFRQTTGRIGFHDLPLEPGDFSDCLVTGYHLARDNTVSVSLPSLGASLFVPDEIDWLLSNEFVAPSTHGSAAPSDLRRPAVFISYASNDFARASAICAYLEEHGLRCWIAPRDINCDILPYTQAIERGLSQVGSVVVLISELANLSVHIPRELDIALERKIPIVPMRLQDVQPAGQLSYLLRTCQWLNAFEGAWAGACAELLERLERIGV